MPAKQIIPGLFEISLGAVNVFLLETEDGLVLIDAGFPDKAEQILKDIRQLGKQPEDIHHIIVTHAHPDHIGSLASLQRATQAVTYIHPLDAPIARTGTGFRPLIAAPGFLTKIMFHLFIRPAGSIEGTAIAREINDGDVLPLAGGLQAIHTPGHCAGHLAFLWPREGVLFVGDACSNFTGLGWTLGYEDIGVGKQSLEKLAQLDFRIACFGHGRAIQQDASQRFKKRWL